MSLVQCVFFFFFSSNCIWYLFASKSIGCVSICSTLLRFSSFRNLKTPEQSLLLRLIRADGNNRLMELDILVLSWCYSLCRKQKSLWSECQRMNTVIWNFLHHTFFLCVAYFLKTIPNPRLSWFQIIADMSKNLIFLKKLKTTTPLFLCEGLKLRSLEVNWLLGLKNKSCWDPSLQ